MILLHTAIAIIAIVIGITALRIRPIFALVIGTLYLGVVSQAGLSDTTKVISQGFGDLMAEVGLLITFGVLMGTLLSATGTLQRLLEKLMTVFGARNIPYAFTLALTTIFCPIYPEVLLVIVAPLARRLGLRIGRPGRDGRAIAGGALTIGIETGLVFIVPGVGAIALAGLFNVPLGKMLLYGLIIGLPTALLSALLYTWLLRYMRWDKEKDEIPIPEHKEKEAGDESRAPQARSSASGSGPGTMRAKESSPRTLPLSVCLIPVFLTLGLLMAKAFLDIANVKSSWLTFFGDPLVALFLGALIAYGLTHYLVPREQVSRVVSEGLDTTGAILVLTGISGSLGNVISNSGLRDMLSGYFSSGFLPPLLLAWLVAVILHLALGSITVAAITAAGIIAPLAGMMTAPMVIVALVVGSGAMFLPHVNSNLFWMFQTTLGYTTRGTIKTHTIGTSLCSIVSLPLILGMNALLF